MDVSTTVKHYGLLEYQESFEPLQKHCLPKFNFGTLSRSGLNPRSLVIVTVYIDSVMFKADSATCNVSIVVIWPRLFLLPIFIIS